MKRVLIMSALLLTAAVAPNQAEAARRPPAVTVAVAPAKVWVPAHQAWSVTLGRFITVSGQWKVPPRGASHWVPGRYVGHGPERRWVPGHWAPSR
jgi:hypothetical protein